MPPKQGSKRRGNSPKDNKPDSLPASKQRQRPMTAKPKPRTERLQKIIAAAGITSRRKAEELIVQGRVTVNRQTIAELGAKADPLTDDIRVDGKRLSNPADEKKVYILLNKPKGYISALSDPLKRPVVVDLVKNQKTRVFPIGRLDYDAEGAIILTNDGELSNKLMHPNFSVPKKYLAKVRDVPDASALEKLEKGVRLEDGKTPPAKARLIRQTQENSWIELVVHEGRNRLVKRMCKAVGHPVSKLKRIEFAEIKLGGLEIGAWRMLTASEVERLRRW